MAHSRVANATVFSFCLPTQAMKSAVRCAQYSRACAGCGRRALYFRPSLLVIALRNVFLPAWAPSRFSRRMPSAMSDVSLAIVPASHTYQGVLADRPRSAAVPQLGNRRPTWTLDPQDNGARPVARRARTVAFGESVEVVECEVEEGGAVEAALGHDRHPLLHARPAGNGGGQHRRYVTTVAGSRSGGTLARAPCTLRENTPRARARAKQLCLLGAVLGWFTPPPPWIGQERRAKGCGQGAAQARRPDVHGDEGPQPQLHLLLPPLWHGDFGCVPVRGYGVHRALREPHARSWWRPIAATTAASQRTNGVPFHAT